MPHPETKPPKKARSFRLTAPLVLESALQAQIITWLRVEQAQGRVSWFCRVNGGLARYGQQRVRNYALHLAGQAPSGKGYADLHGMLPGGRYFALEVKRPGETATDEQAAFIRAVQRGGGIAEVVTSFDEVAAFFRAHTKQEQSTPKQIVDVCPFCGMEVLKVQVRCDTHVFDVPSCPKCGDVVAKPGYRCRYPSPPSTAGHLAQ